MTESDSLAPPLVPADKSLAEITIKALVLGVVLSAILAAANAYIGLLVGLTVSASIPAAAASMGLLRLFRRSTILENNMVQTAASAGESLAAGIIFTIPALVLMRAWTGYEYGPLVAIALVGGILGVAFTIPLRRALIVEARLRFPEGVATAEVLKTGGIETVDHHTASADADAARRGFRVLIKAAGLGALIKALESGLGWLAGSVAGVKAFLGGKYLAMGSINLSPALVGVGYIVGLNIALLVFLGGVIGTVIGVPLNWLFNGAEIMTKAGIDPGMSLDSLDSHQWAAVAGQAWQDVRRVGVGAMMVGGVWSLISLAKPLVTGVKASLHAYRESRVVGNGGVPRTDFDTPIIYVGIVALLATIPLFLIFLHALGDYPDRVMIASVMTILMLVFGFIFASVAGYMAGLVGSSNNPVSGITIATVIFSALILLQLMGSTGQAATLGPIAVIFLAGLICSAAAIAGDNMQDLKCGHILGATPWRQQVMQVVGVIGAALVIPVVLEILDHGYGIGRPSPINPGAQPLSAPQAGLMQALATGIFGDGIEWNFIFMGFALAIVLIILDKVQESRGSHFRFPVLAVAVGIYLPLGLSVPIFIGGLIAYYIDRHSSNLHEKQRKKQEQTGLLVASGLITGEALMGVVVAALAGWGFSHGLNLPLTNLGGWSSILGVVALLVAIAYQYRKTKSAGDD
ncbi:OPT family oligopeptide transporter [Biformimicrobium ophioploci]|uniref:Oligopeptide transporter, OPT family n=1 Tax=Biformimicrobium ophioploci TaxID=3036711 RepID=A0ABQ6LXU1_9GAMM|nr:oligopeptide transporter, OPT family [Microbulbifer sp. NKW57]GMG86851.1 oligopeptide transporter, OPT family [Microbulbifer sp. NKW57]